MQLETYISDLLYRYECVTIPEFGAFITQRISAKINEQNHTFYPPKKALSFNENIQQNDGLLARYIADVEKIPFESALNKISKRVRDFKSYLTQGEVLVFKNIGELKLSSEGKMLFEPLYTLNYLTDAFGLSEFNSPQILREVYKDKVETIEKVVPITISDKKRKSRSFFKYASVAVLALTLGGLVASNYYVNSIETHNQLAQEEATEQLNSKIQEATFVIENPLTAVTLNVNKQTGNYHIVAGAFRVKENSIKKVNELKSLGFNARVLGVNKYGLHEVAYSSYQTGSEALKAVREIRKTHNKDAWIKVDSKSDTNTNNHKSSTYSTIGKISRTTNNNLGKESSIIEIEPSNESANDAPNFIKIIKGITSVESGYYVSLGSFSNISDRDAFLKQLNSNGLNNNTFFVDTNTEKYIVYHIEKFDDFEAAKTFLNTVKDSSPYKGNKEMTIVKLEN